MWKKSLLMVTPLLLLFTAALLWVTCGERITGQNDNPTSPSVSEAEKPMVEASRITLAVPDSVPIVVDEAALNRAFELNCSGIRILQVAQAKEETYYVTYFDQPGSESEESGLL